MAVKIKPEDLFDFERYERATQKLKEQLSEIASFMNSELEECCKGKPKNNKEENGRN